MNAEQLQKTLRASQYAELVLGNHSIFLEQDYAIDQFINPLTTQQIQHIVQTSLDHLTDEATWMREIRILRARLMFRWIWQDANQLTDVVTLTRELSDFADATICAAKDFARIPLVAPMAGSWTKVVKTISKSDSERFSSDWIRVEMLSPTFPPVFSYTSSCRFLSEAVKHLDASPGGSSLYTQTSQSGSTRMEEITSFIR